jgi:hypothetical protein
VAQTSHDLTNDPAATTTAPQRLSHLGDRLFTEPCRGGVASNHGVSAEERAMSVFISRSRKDVGLPEFELLLSDLDLMRQQVWFDERLTGGQAWWDEVLT